MTATSTQAKSFPTKYTIAAIALAATAVAIIAIGQWLVTDAELSISAPDTVSVVASPQTAGASTATSGLVQALNSGKFDAGLVTTPAAPVAATAAAPLSVVVNGQGGLYDALIAGKFTTDFGPQDVTGSGAITSGLVHALNSGKFDAGLVTTPAPSVAATAAAPLPATVSGQGGLYDALIAGKFTTDFAPQNFYPQYVPRVEAGATISGLTIALDNGKFDEDLETATPTVPLPSAATHTPTVSGGHQQ